MDVDGTLTDGGLYIGAGGEVMKRFHVKDGYAIHDLLPQMGIVPIIITGRTSEIVAQRCRELGITRLVQGSSNKIEDLKKILADENISITQVAYMGDDLNDYDCMKQVGLKGCPSDAVSEIKSIADYVTQSNGGNGAVREFVEWIREKGE
ncbi:MAG: HAD-IIIA family hydrolase [Lachnospiraceae bacterium]|nr:HAD-IIIA family hydrolase [Lachnospiraceae bacterium]